MPYKSFPFALPSVWKGAGWKIVSSLCFAASAALVKELSSGCVFGLPLLSVYQIIFIANLVSLTSLLLLQRRSPRLIFQTKFKMFQIVRTLFSVGGLLMWYFSVTLMPMAQLTALSFVGPAITVTGAYLFLQEVMSMRRVCSVILSLIGAFVILRPDVALLQKESMAPSLGAFAFLPLLSTVLFSVAKIVSRTLARKGEKATTTTAYIFTGLVPLSCLLALWNWCPLDLFHLPFLFCTGFLSFAAHWTTVHAYTYAPINFLTPFGLLRLVAGIVIGWSIFNEHFEAGFWIGSVLIGGSMINLVYERREAPQKQELFPDSISFKTDRAA